MLQINVCQTFGKHFALFIYLYIYIVFAENFTGSKDTEPYKMDVSFLCHYIYLKTGLPCRGSGSQH